MKVLVGFLFAFLSLASQAGVVTCDFSDTTADPFCESELDAEWFVLDGSGNDLGPLTKSAVLKTRTTLGNTYVATNQTAGRIVSLQFDSDVSFLGGAFSTHSGTLSFNLFVTAYHEGIKVGSAVLPAFKEEPPATYFGGGYFGTDFEYIDRLDFLACITASPCAAGFDFSIDNLSVELDPGAAGVPSPGTFPVFVFGMLGLGLARKLRFF